VSKAWKVAVVFSFVLNAICFAAIAIMVDVVIDAQWENLGLFHQLSGDQQALRRELNAATAQFEDSPQKSP